MERQRIYPLPDHGLGWAAPRVRASPLSPFEIIPASLDVITICQSAFSKRGQTPNFRCPSPVTPASAAWHFSRALFHAPSPSVQLHDQPILERDAPVHARRDVHVVGGDDDREARGLHQLGE